MKVKQVEGGCVNCTESKPIFYDALKEVGKKMEDEDMRTETEILEDLKYAEYMADNAVAVKKPHETKSEFAFWYEKYKEYSDELDEVRVKTICPYCTESKPIYYDGQLQVEIKDTDLCIHCVTSDFGRVYYTLQIKYCPECGRKL